MLQSGGAAPHTREAIWWSVDARVTLISGVCLAMCMWQWPQGYLFSKVMVLPSWAEAVPHALYLPVFMVLMCLAPIIFYAPSLLRAMQNMAWVILLFSFIPLIFYLFKSEGNDQYLLYNLIFNYVWVVGWHCLPAALFWLMLRGVWQWMRHGIRSYIGSAERDLR